MDSAVEHLLCYVDMCHKTSQKTSLIWPILANKSNDTIISKFSDSQDDRKTHSDGNMRRCFKRKGPFGIHSLQTRSSIRKTPCLRSKKILFLPQVVKFFLQLRNDRLETGIALITFEQHLCYLFVLTKLSNRCREGGRGLAFIKQLIRLSKQGSWNRICNVFPTGLVRNGLVKICQHAIPGNVLLFRKAVSLKEVKGKLHSKIISYDMKDFFL